MTIGVTQLGDSFPGSGSGTLTVSISWAADTILVFCSMAHRNTSDFTLGFTAGTSGLTWQQLGSGQAHSTFSIGHGRGDIYLAKPGGSGSGTVGLTTSATAQQRGIDVYEVTGLDLAGADALATVVQDHTAQLVGQPSNTTLNVDIDQDTDSDNIWFINAGSVISDFDLAGVTPDASDTEYTGSGGEHETHYGTGVITSGGSPDFSLDPAGNVGGTWAIFAELLAPQAAEPEGWPEAFIGIHAAPNPP